MLYILIFINLFIYVTNIKNNYENYLIMQKTIVGNLILYWNFISMCLLLILANKVKKLDMSVGPLYLIHEMTIYTPFIHYTDKTAKAVADLFRTK